jgi:succinyl-diaminopimelate desuccinylase
VALADTLLWLCKMPSPIGEERALCDALQARLERCRPAAPLRRYGDSLVVPLSRASGGPHVVLGGHLDVVRTEHAGPPRIEGDRLYGPGAADMKSGLSLMLELAENGVPSGVDLTLVFYAREEGPFADNELGLVLERDRELAGASLAVMLEPSDNKLQLGCGGSIHASARFVGRTAHSARPWQGDNAIHKAADLLTRLAAGEPRSDVVDGLEWKSVVSATLARGGRARNVIPDEFELNLNHRFGPSTSVAAAQAFLAEVVGGQAELTFTDVSPAAPPLRNNPLVVALAESGVSAVEPKQAWTDVARFAMLGVPAVNFGPGVQAQAHQKDEWTLVSQLDAGRRILRTWLSTIALALAGFALFACEESRGRTQGLRAEAVTSRGSSPAGPSLFSAEPLSAALSQLKAQAGPAVSALRLEVHASQILLQARDPRDPKRVLQYRYRNGGLEPPRPVELRGGADLEDNLFSLSSVSLEKIPELTRLAVERVDAQDGKVSYVLVRRDLPDSDEVEFRVYVDSPRKAGHLDADKHGKPLNDD